MRGLVKTAEPPAPGPLDIGSLRYVGYSSAYVESNGTVSSYAGHESLEAALEEARTNGHASRGRIRRVWVRGVIKGMELGPVIWDWRVYVPAEEMQPYDEVPPRRQPHTDGNWSRNPAW